MIIIKNLGIILIILIAVVFTLLIILINIEKRLHKKIIKKKSSRDIFYLKRIEGIPKIDSRKTLINIDKIAREFLKEAFKIKGTEDYSILEDFFNQKGNNEIAEFCDSMNNALYSGKKINKEDSQKLISSLIKIIKDNPLFIKEELKKKEVKKPGILNYLKNIKVSGIGKKEIKNKQDNSK